jgi:phage terminase large subunit-like protein
MLQFGLRLGQRPRQLITTTPRPIPLIKRLLSDSRTAVTHAPTQANAAHLSPAFLAEVLARYDGTRLGRQEIDGEIIEDRADALWTRAMIEASRFAAAPPLVRIVIGIDPPGSSRPGADACGIVAAGIAEDGRIYVLEDASVLSLAPAGWAMKAVALFSRLKADALGAEVNQGGDMVRAVLEQIDPAIPLRTVHATRGKWLRAEPVAMLYQQGPRQTCRSADGVAGGRDVRLRPQRAVLRRLAGSARCPGLGGDGTDRAWRAAGATREHTLKRQARACQSMSADIGQTCGLSAHGPRVGPRGHRNTPI